ncbi:hypothetical protein QWZ16_15395 [Vibrio ostreicida]|uniref:Methyl-accepting chemotaxis protein n=1 Tax=Vibrio ostreicida TaxID=526588 RepID=A0ABT8BXE8_9VIBR|nr:hypothetical protein [Vibrio ostreicida]MDN3611059.1 hypothetical protein [Vibrio ostreicida]
MDQTDNNAQLELAEIEHVATAMEQLTSASNHLSGNAQLADATARQADQLLSQGLTCFNKVAKRISR